MFDFLKPEVSGFKNVLNGYFAYTNQFDRSDSDMRNSAFFEDFAEYYYSIRLGPPLVSNPADAVRMKTNADLTSRQLKGSDGSWNLLIILKGLLAAEGMDYHNIDLAALRKLLNKFPPIPEDILGF